MDANWQACLKAILAEEGGSDDDPHDPGGRTSRGIIQREYDAWRHLNGMPEGDVWKATAAEIDDIYYSSYWLPWCPRLPPGVDLIYFNMGVNAGPHESTLLLQRALNVTADGHIGVVTLSAIQRADARGTIHKFSEGCRAFYRGLRGYRYYGKGWMRRTAEIEAAAIKMVGG